MQRIGAVSFLNSRPLVAGLELEPEVAVTTDVPSRLLAALETGRGELALCPVVAYQRAAAELCVVPVGAIGSDGPTLTVRLFSRVPLDRLVAVAVDPDSHTSVALLQVVLADLNGRAPAVVPADLDGGRPGDGVEGLLLIGDKVISSAPGRRDFPFQLDLGEAWKRLTGLPFVFATWMAAADAHLGGLPDLLARTRRRNLERLDDIVAADAARLGWPPAAARHYLAELLCFEVGPPQLAAMQLFWQRCAALGIIDRVRPLRLYRDRASDPSADGGEQP